MNKSWKTFDELKTSPGARLRRTQLPKNFSIRSTSSLNASRVISCLKKTEGHSQTLVKRKTGVLSASNVENSNNSTLIEDTSVEEISESYHSDQENYHTHNNISPTSFNRTAITQEESDLEDLPDDESLDVENIPETDESDGDDSDCQSIHCKRIKTCRLDFQSKKSSRCGKRITDDSLIVASAVERAATTEKSSSWIMPMFSSNKQGSYIPKTPINKKRSSWQKLNETFKSSPKIAGDKKSPSQRKWSSLSETFQDNDSTMIEQFEPSPQFPGPKELKEQTSDETVGYFYETGPSSTTSPTSLLRMKYRKDCPISQLQMVLKEKNSRQVFWLHERQMRGNVRVIRVESVEKLFGRIILGFHDNDKDDTDTKVEHFIYLDPAEKQLQYLAKGSLLDIEFDLEPHRISKRKIVHLGVSKIRVHQYQT
ncbi:uncharacterized protein LOC129759365 isoform X2 [Uranotaenia lowii]|uniref:uncharacterized protein LOC129759365 isoform X2 n=1 Tax=Uranotaenia lowii TaxID=190385 RepID=UPI00247A6562|nr:uncharacterized protein LOC129759365 isoform X2 [Uranotaenia lowii]